MAGDVAVMIKTMSGSYVNSGPPISLSFKAFDALFPHERNRVLLNHAAGHVEGCVLRKDRHDGHTNSSLNLTTGWPAVKRQLGVAVGDEIEFRYEAPSGGGPPAIRITILSRGNPVAAPRARASSPSRRKRKPGRPPKASAGPPDGKRPRPGAERSQQAQQAQQPDRHGLQQLAQAVAQHQREHGLQGCAVALCAVARLSGKAPPLAAPRAGEWRAARSAELAFVRRQQAQRREPAGGSEEEAASAGPEGTGGSWAEESDEEWGEEEAPAVDEGAWQPQRQESRPEQQHELASPYSGSYALPDCDGFETSEQHGVAPLVAAQVVAAAAPSDSAWAGNESEAEEAPSGGEAESMDWGEAGVVAGGDAEAASRAEAEPAALQARRWQQEAPEAERQQQQQALVERLDTCWQLQHPGREQHPEQQSQLEARQEQLQLAPQPAQQQPAPQARQQEAQHAAPEPDQQQQHHQQQQAQSATPPAPPADATSFPPGSFVLLPCPPDHPLRPAQRWLSAKVLGAVRGRPGILMAQVLAARPPLEGGEGDWAATGPALEEFRAADVAALLPHELLGWTVKKLFPVTNVGSELFVGTVTHVNEAGDPTFYRVEYDDGDLEDLDLDELLPVLDAPPRPGTDVSHLRRQQQRQQQQQQQRQRSPSARARGRPPKPGGPRRRASGAGGARRSDAAAGSAAWLRLEAAPEVLAAARQAGGAYAAGGAGHERGALAYDKRADARRPVGPWLADRDLGTQLGRRAGIDKRHLADRQLPEGPKGYRSPMVPGWIGVCVAGNAHWTPEYEGRYHVVCYDSPCATHRRVPSVSWATVEEAAAMYDRMALLYFGELADTNFPPTHELLEELCTAKAGEGGTMRQATPLAARLLCAEQCVPDSAVAGGAASAEDWSEWERSLEEGFLFGCPPPDAPALLAAKLGWFLRQLPEAAILPWYRGTRLAAFLAACDACTELGSAKDHYAPSSAACHVCAAYCGTAGDSGGCFNHGSAKLHALMREAEEVIVSQSALQAFLEGADEEEAAAAAAAEGAEKGGRLRAWARSGGGGGGGGPARDATAPRSAPRGGGARPAPPPARQPKPVPPGLSVIVIGAGVAGLKAAADLARCGARVTVLEARRRIGGRINTVQLGEGLQQQPVDLGAAFVCGTSRRPPVNPMLRYAVDQLGLKLRPKRRHGPDATALYRSDGSLVPGDVQAAAEERYAELLEALVARAEAADSGETLRQAVDAVLAEMGLAGEQRAAVEACLADLHAAPPAAVSLGGSVGPGYGGPHGLVQGGFARVVQALVEGRLGPGRAVPVDDVRLGRVVRRVALLPGGAGAEVQVEGRAEPLRAHAVLCTLPLGCLQRGAVAFDPPLPPYKQQAISGLAMGAGDRVALLFDEVFWPERPHCLRPLAGRYTFENLHALGVPRVLCACVRPQHADAFEAMSDGEVLADVGAALRQLFPRDYRPPTAHAVTRWRQDPYCYGAYSYVPPHGRKAYFEWLSYPVSGVAAADAKSVEQRGLAVLPETRLWFAGEASSKHDACTVHGAFTTGQQQAGRIKRWWRQHHEAVRQLEAAAAAGAAAAQRGGGEEPRPG